MQKKIVQTDENCTFKNLINQYSSIKYLINIYNSATLTTKPTGWLVSRYNLIALYCYWNDIVY